MALASAPRLRSPVGWALASVAAAALALVALPAVGAAPEAEPNNGWYEASPASFSEPGTGTVHSNDADFWRLDLAEPMLLTVTAQGPSGSVLTAVVDEVNSEHPSALDEGAPDHVRRLVVTDTGPIFVRVTTRAVSAGYTLSFSNSTDWEPVEGAGEAEPNNERAAATPLVLNTTQGGRANLSWADRDWWSLETSGYGWLRLYVDSEGWIAFTVYSGAAELEDEAWYSDGFHQYEVKSGGRVEVLFEVDWDSVTEYTVRAEFRTDASLFYEGPDETEPNGDASQAKRIEVGETVHGLGNYQWDEADLYLIQGEAGDLVEVNVTVDEEAYYGVEVEYLAADGTWQSVSEGNDTYRLLSFLFGADRDMLFNVTVGTESGAYTVTSSSRRLTAFDDGVVTLQELVDTPELEAEFTPKNSPGFSLLQPQGYDLATGDGYMFGETLCAWVALPAEIPVVRVEAGQRFTPEDAALQDFVASRTMDFAIPEGGEGCFRAMSWSEDGEIGFAWDLYALAGRAEGDAATVIAEVDASRRDGADGQLALWAVTSGTSEGRARQWSASPGTISGARAILTDAGVRTTLSPNAGPAAGGGGGGGAGGLGALPYVVLAVIALVLIGAAVAVRRPGKAPPTPPMGAPGAAGPVTPAYGGPAYAPYPGQYAGAAGQPYLPPPPPASSTPYGSQYAPYGPTGYAQQVPAAPAPVQEPAYVAAGTAPCPGCGQPVAYYAPACTSCGHALTWS